MTKKITFFEAQFPTEDVVEISRACFSESENKFIEIDLNIGWVMSVTNSKLPYMTKKKLKEDEHRYDRQIYKKCQGAMECRNSSCCFYKQCMRPPVNEKKIGSIKCSQCKSFMSWIKCNVKVEFFFSVKRSDCTMTHSVDAGNNLHTHGSFVQKHLTQKQVEQVDRIIVENPSITPNAAIAGIANSKILSNDLDVENINPILLNQHRLKHEFRASRIRNGLNVSSNDLFEEFTKIENEFPGYIVSAELVSSNFCIMFSSPEMAMSRLPFETYPMITDVTFNAVCQGYYLCSTVIFVPVMKKHIVIFQAIIKHLTANQFTVYFKALFAMFSIKPESFLGMIMDFSQAQREGFFAALRTSFGLDKPEAMSFLKGCYMHWKQSVQRVSSNHAIVPSDKVRLFESLVYRLKHTNVDRIFDEVGKTILREFPNSRRWLQWWLQPTVASTIFECRTLMKDDLRKHAFRTSNAIEAYHSALYKLIPKKKPIGVSLALILKVCRRDGRLLRNYYQTGVAPVYGGSKNTKVRKNYVNDGRAPDCNSALFGSKNKRKVVVEEEVEKKKEFGVNFVDLFNVENKFKKQKVNERDDFDEEFTEFLEEEEKLLNNKNKKPDDENDVNLQIFEKLNDDMLETLGGYVEDDIEELMGDYDDIVNKKPSVTKPIDSDVDLDNNEDAIAIRKSLSNSSDEKEKNVDASPISLQQFVNDNEKINSKTLSVPQYHKYVPQYRKYIEEYNKSTNGIGKILGLYTKNSGLTIIAHNSSNSCYIDANFELLWNAILPFVAVDTIDWAKNECDSIIIQSYFKYISDVDTIQQKILATNAASVMAREFVWNMTTFKNDNVVPLFERGREHCALELLSVLMLKMSSELKNLICAFPDLVPRSHICSNNQLHSEMNYDEFPMILEIDNSMRDAISAEKSYLSEKHLEQEFNSIFSYQTIIREKEAKCYLGDDCNGLVLSRNIVDSNNTPPFLFISDPTNFIGRERTQTNIYFPETITICDTVNYVIHGRVYSTSSYGVHFYTICYKVLKNVTFLVRIDNLKGSMAIITSDMEKARKILRQYPNTVYVCYKKKIEIN